MDRIAPLTLAEKWDNVSFFSFSIIPFHCPTMARRVCSTNTSGTGHTQSGRIIVRFGSPRLVKELNLRSSPDRSPTSTAAAAT